MKIAIGTTTGEGNAATTSSDTRAERRATAAAAGESVGRRGWICRGWNVDCRTVAARWPNVVSESFFEITGRSHVSYCVACGRQVAAIAYTVGKSRNIVDRAVCSRLSICVAVDDISNAARVGIVSRCRCTRAYITQSLSN